MAEAESSNNNPLVDDFYFSALFDEEEIFPISDEKYAQELHLQEALFSSAEIYSRTQPGSSKTKEYSYQYSFSPAPLISLKGKEKETGEFSDSLEYIMFCGICMDAKPNIAEIFKSNTCSHVFCNDCIGKYIATKIQENTAVVKCPEFRCSGILEAHNCQSIIPKEVFERWEDALCESLIMGSQKFYCPFMDCSALLVDDGGDDTVTQAECPNCRRMFCAQCKVAWHAGVKCSEFLMLDSNERTREDLLVMEMARNNKWRRCPKCMIFVDKISGCLHISCRCGYEFCYSCGQKWSTSHGSSCG